MLNGVTIYRNGITKIPKWTLRHTETGLNKCRVGQGMYFFFCTNDTMDFFSLGICQLLIVYHVEWSMIGK